MPSVGHCWNLKADGLDLIETRTRRNVNIRTTAHSVRNGPRHNISVIPHHCESGIEWRRFRTPRKNVDVECNRVLSLQPRVNAGEVFLAMKKVSTDGQLSSERHTRTRDSCVRDSGTLGQRHKSRKPNDHNKLRVPRLSHSSICSESFRNLRK